MMKYVKILRNCFLIGLILIGHSSGVVSAIVKSKRPGYAQNNILFYDTEDECSTNVDKSTRCVPTGSSSTDGSDVTWIGDSYSVESLDKIKAKLPNVDLGTENPGNQYSPYSYIQFGKHLDWVSNSNNNDTAGGKSGIDILKEIISTNKLRSTLVLALGTNDQMNAPSTKNTLEEIDNLVKGKAQKVVILTAKTRITDFTDLGNTEKKEFADSHDNFVLADWVPAYKDEFYQTDSEHPEDGAGYDTWLDVILGTLGGGTSCTAGLTSGNTIEERVWNWFVNSKIEGLYNNPAAIAGILGNFYQESHYNPFIIRQDEAYIGIFQVEYLSGSSQYGIGLKNAVDKAVGRDLWAKYGYGEVEDELKDKNVTQEELDAAVSATLSYLTDPANEQYTGWSIFTNGLSEVENNTGENGAGSYSDLFLVTIERAMGGNSTITDTKVMAYASKHAWGYKSPTYQDADKRREYAKEAYKRLSGSTTGAVPTASTGASSSTSAATTTSNYNATSSGGFKKYTDLTETEIIDLAEAVVSENSYNEAAVRNEASILANLNEDKRNGANGNFSSITDYAKNGGWFACATTFWIDGKRNEGSGSCDCNCSGTCWYPEVTSQQIEWVRDVIVNGNRTLPPEIIEHDCVKCGAGVDHAYNDDSQSEDIIDSPEKWIPGKTKLVQASGGLSGTWIYYGFMCDIVDWHKCDPYGFLPGEEPSSMPAISSSASSSFNDPCISSSNNSGTATGSGGGSIAEVAKRLAWGDKDHPKDINPEFLAAAKALGQSTRSYCPISSRELDYAQDCAIFVSVVVRTAGVDPGFPKGYTGDLLEHMSNSDKWQVIDNLGNESNLEPGDVFVVHQGGGTSGHTFIYIGDGKIASASLCNYTGQVQDVYFSDHRGDYHIFRSTVQTSSGGGTTGSFDADLKALESDGHKVGAAVSAMGNKDSSKVQVGGSWSGGRAWSTIKVPLAIAAIQDKISTTSYKDTYTGCSNSPSDLNLDSAVSAAITRSDNCGAWWLWEGLGGNGSSAADSVTKVIKDSGDSSTSVNGTEKRTDFLTSGYTNWSLAGQALFAANMANLSGANSVMAHMDNQSGDDSNSGLNTIGSKNLSKGGWGDDTGTSATRQFGIVKWEDGKCSAVAIGTDANGSSFGTLTKIAEVLKNHQSELPSGTCPSGV